MKNVKMSENTKRLIGEKNKINRLGRKAKEETKRKMSAKRVGKTNWGNCLISYEQAYQIKEKILNGDKLTDIAVSTGIDYKIINNIYSCNSYKSVKINGWDNFIKNKTNTRLKITQEMIDRMKELSKNMNKIQIAKELGVCRHTIRKYLSK